MSAPDTPREQARLWLELYRDLGIGAIAPRRPAGPGPGGPPPERAAPAEPPAPAEPAAAPGRRDPLEVFEARPRMLAEADAAAIEQALREPDPARALARLREAAIGDCRRCALHADRRNIVFGTGNPAARLMFVGEGPGAAEDRRGEPFVGRAGELLDRIIAAMGLRRDEVYIGNVVKCRPPENRDPLPNEGATCLPFLEAQIAVIQPEVLVSLGRVPLTWLVDRSLPSVTRVRGRWFDYCGIPLMATFHPAFLLREPHYKRPVWEDMQAVMGRLGLPRPG
jgi:DNA polymerase